MGQPVKDGPVEVTIPARYSKLYDLAHLLGMSIAIDPRGLNPPQIGLKPTIEGPWTIYHPERSPPWPT